ncbi:unnamed protein product [Pleuronectes platessa]|uniref:Uncharacterized protein n=1 Tax=Pleuronectes platessa TaxID=8262 RepID=A0A9N7UW79_PLEPL|nr:unnamed protein product [Pleuronectes platessa]
MRSVLNTCKEEPVEALRAALTPAVSLVIETQAAREGGGRLAQRIDARVQMSPQGAGTAHRRVHGGFITLIITGGNREEERPTCLVFIDGCPRPGEDSADSLTQLPRRVGPPEHCVQVEQRAVASHQPPGPRLRGSLIPASEENVCFRDKKHASWFIYLNEFCWSEPAEEARSLQPRPIMKSGLEDGSSVDLSESVHWVPGLIGTGAIGVVSVGCRNSLVGVLIDCCGGRTHPSCHWRLAGQSEGLPGKVYEFVEARH